MANIKISQLPAKGANLASADLLEVSEFTGTGYVSKSITGQEIIDAIPAGAAVNPTSTYMPVNDGGVFVDSGFYRSGAPTEENTILTYKDNYNRTRLKIDATNDYYSFGYADATYTAAVGGIAISNNTGEAIIGCGMSSPSNGVFRASSASGIISLGSGFSYAIGYNNNFNSMHVGSSIIQGGSYSPLGAYIPVTDENGTTYYLALYM